MAAMIIIGITVASLAAIAISTVVYHIRTARQNRRIADATINAAAWERIRQEHEWQTALVTRRGITPIDGRKGKRHE